MCPRCNNNEVGGGEHKSNLWALGFPCLPCEVGREGAGEELVTR